MYRLVFLLASIFYLNFLSRIISAPLLPYLERSMGLSHAQSSSIFMLLSSGYFIAILCSGFLSSRINHRNTIALSAVMIGISVGLTSFSTGIAGLRLGFFAMGLSAGLYLPSAVAVISSEFPKGIWGRVFAFHELAPNLAFITAPFLVALLLDACSWQVILRGLSLSVTAAGIIFFLLSGDSSASGTVPDMDGIREVIRSLGVVPMIAMFSMGVLGTLGIYNLLPLFLVNVHGMTEVSANEITGFSRLATVLAALTSGFVADRAGAWRTMAGVLILSGALVVIMSFVAGNLLYAAVFLQPVIAVGFFPAAFSVLSSLVSETRRNLVISLVVPLAYVAGGGALPWFTGWLADMGMFRAGFGVSGVLMAAAGCMAMVLARKGYEA